MDTIRRSISAEELRGSVTAVVISVDDLELLEELEAARDAAEFAAAKAAGDGERVSLEELRAEVE
jgi:hypothetical protein